MRESLRRMGAIARKELIHIRRDPRIMISVLVMPTIQLLLFAYAISFDVTDVPTLFLDGDRSATSREYLSEYEQSSFFDVIGRVDSMEAIDDAFDRSTARIAVMVRPGFGEAIARGEKGEVSVLIDGSEPNSAQLGQSYTLALNQQLGRDVSFGFLERQAIDPSRAGGITPYTRTWYNPDRRSADFLIPGLMVVIIMIVTVQQTAVTLVKEREQGTFEQITVSPIRRGEIMLGKVTPWVALGLVDMFVVTIIAVVVFGVPLRGDITTLAVATFLFILCSLGIGLLVSARARTVESANLVALLISFLPAFMLSGFAFPLNSIPPFLQFVSYLFPGRYMVVVARSVFLKGGGFEELWPQIGALAIYALISLTMATLLYSRRTD